MGARCLRDMGRAVTLSERIERGRAAIEKAKAEGRDVGAWEKHLAHLERETAEPSCTPLTPARAWEIERVTDLATGELRAVHICSAQLESHLWVLADPEFIPVDNDPIFFADEFEFLKTKSIETMREVLEVKRVYPRSRVIQ